MALLRPIRAPVFEIGLKGYSWGADALRLAVEADRLAGELGVTVVYDPQAVDIPAIAAATRHLHVFAQHMDPLPPGRGVGGTLAEALREAGAVGTLLNHSERRMTLPDIARAIERARETGLGTLVFADSPAEAAALAHLRPDIILAEPPELIATGRSAGGVMAEFVAATIVAVKGIDPSILVMSGAGVNGPEDVARMVELGLDGTGSSSGILKADDPVRVMTEMLEALAAAALAAPAPPGRNPRVTAHHATVKVHSPLHKPGFHDVTADAIAAVTAAGIRTGILNVYSQHTTCSVLIQEESMDQTLDGVESLLQDMVNILTGLVPTCRHEGQYLHPGPKHLAHATGNGEEGWWSLNTDAHLRSVLLGRSESIPVVDGRPELGEFGRIYFADFDGMRQRDRTVHFMVVGE